MGNTKSRHALPGGSSRKNGKHSKHSNRNLDQYHQHSRQNSSNYIPISPGDAYPTQSALPYDSGHYSIGSLAHPSHPEYAGGSYTNLSGRGRLEYQKKPSDSSLRLQYGSRVKRSPLAGNGSNGAIHNGSLKASVASHSYMNTAMTEHGLYNVSLPGGQEMVYQYRGTDSRPPSIAPRYSHSRMSSSYTQQNSSHLQPYQQYGPTSTSFQPHQYNYLRPSNGVPVAMNGRGEDMMTGIDGKIPSLAALSLGMNDPGRQSQDAVRYLPPRPPQPYLEPTYSPQVQPYHSKGMGVRPDQMDPRIQGEYAYPNHRIINGHPMNGKAGVPTAMPRAVEMLAKAGPLVDCGPLTQERPIGPEDVFARLLKQYPTNPHEADKRERIYRWMDHVGRALTFNPDVSRPGWIIPVNPDELDHTDSPFYLDRITYELDLMAPSGKPLKKAIDVNCGSGEWAIDLAMKYPRTIVYALDPLLNATRLPSRIPENCRFKLRDVKNQEGEFDLVHQRLSAFRTEIQEWTPHFAELGRLTRPGGWIQLAECNGIIVRAGVESLKVNRWVEKAALSSGLNPTQMVEALMPTILGAGLINVECYEYGIPLGDWAGRRGNLAMRTYLSWVESLRSEIIEMNRLEDGMFEETMALMKMECAVENAELVMKVICAQKPPVTDDLWRL